MSVKHKHTILVVDDEKIIRIVFKQGLKSKGYKVLTAENGKIALKLVKNKNVDLILLDIMMPEMDGFTTLETLKKDESTSHIPVIMLTAISQDFEMAKAFDLGAENYLIKPFSIKDLDIIDKLLN